jgi:hypothetical protein
MGCPVCFNAATADDTVRTSLNLGILVLMGITACVLAGFMRFIISIARKSYAQADLKVRLYDGRGTLTSGRQADVEAGLQPRLETGTP